MLDAVFQTLRKNALRLAPYVVIYFTFLVLMFPAVAVAASASREYQLKAAFLYKFLAFIDWDETVASRTARMHGGEICILGSNPFGDSFDRLIELNGTEERRVSIRQVVGPAVPESCSILFVSRSEEGHLGGVLDGMSNSSVVTVSDIDGFAQKGGIIELVVQDRFVRFLINQERARSKGIRLSSQLLALAQQLVVGSAHEYLQAYIASA